MALYAPLTTTLAALALLGIPVALALIVAALAPGTRARLADRFAGQERHPLAWAWIVSVLAMGGSLYLSDVVGLTPCLFCWYQRIAMYPLAVILGIAAYRPDPDVWRYALPLAVIGILFSIYHVAIQFQPSIDVGACTSGVPCSARYLAVFGFVSIPFLAGAAFLLIIAFLLLVRAGDTRSGAWAADAPPEA